ncbi:hypothetical protein TIFTF001_039728 [Ficus carica]|uniref:Uncharacterized protein n=1 Tax=Ficus carica TaxID=3494 RepID=A0AA87YUN5_FICCA|nr:hypothetical protein TIFTF001_039728 [Ficus carica]
MPHNWSYSHAGRSEPPHCCCLDVLRLALRSLMASVTSDCSGFITVGYEEIAIAR